MLKTSVRSPALSRISEALLGCKKGKSSVGKILSVAADAIPENISVNRSFGPICRNHHTWIVGRSGPTRYTVDAISTSGSSYIVERRFSTSSKESGVLSNERLIQALMSKHGASSADTIQVRLVSDETPPKKATVEIVSLSEAIRKSLDRHYDLVGTQINADPPVIRATDLVKLEYQQSQKAAASKTKSQGMKSFRFKANIADHDLERKVSDMTKFLKQGVDCDFSVSINRQTMRKDETNGENSGLDLVERIILLASEYGAPSKNPQVNEAGNYIRVRLQPTKQK